MPIRKLSLLLFLFSFAVLTSCSDDEGDDTTDCVKNDFIGAWDMVETCGVNNFQYQLTVADSGSGLLLTNLGGLGVNSKVYATVTGSTFSIAPQPVQTATFSGNGSLNGGCVQLTISWQGGPNGSCGGTGTK